MWGREGIFPSVTLAVTVGFFHLPLQRAGAGHVPELCVYISFNHLSAIVGAWSTGAPWSRLFSVCSIVWSSVCCSTLVSFRLLGLVCGC